MRGIKEEYHEKLREVQKTTAMRVLSRFFKKCEPVDTSTQVEEDPLQIELDAAHAQIKSIELERIKEKIEVERIMMNEQTLNKQIKNLFQKLREANSELSFTKDTLESSNSKVKQLQFEYTKFNDQVSRLRDQLGDLQDQNSELKMKC